MRSAQIIYLGGEGFDHAALDTLILAMPISWRGTLQQYARRLHLDHAGKSEVRIVDLVDKHSIKLFITLSSRIGRVIPS
jgi:superfamily II DNA or RNA helicase